MPADAQAKQQRPIEEDEKQRPMEEDGHSDRAPGPAVYRRRDGGRLPKSSLPLASRTGIFSHPPNNFRNPEIWAGRRPLSFSRICSAVKSANP